MFRSDLSQMKARAAMKRSSEASMKKAPLSDKTGVLESSDDDQWEEDASVVRKGAPEWIIKHCFQPQHPTHSGNLGPCDGDTTTTTKVATLPQRRRFNVRDQLHAAAKTFTLLDLGFEKEDVAAEPEDINRSVSCYGFVTLGARLLAHTHNKVSSSSAAPPPPKCIITLPPVSSRGPLISTSVPNIKSNLSTVLVSDVFSDALLEDVLTNLSASIHQIPLSLYLRSNKITEVATKGTSSAKAPQNQQVSDALQKYIIAALANDSEITASGQGDEQTLFWEFTGFSASVLGRVDRDADATTTIASPATTAPHQSVDSGGDNAPSTTASTEEVTTITTNIVMTDVVSPVDEKAANINALSTATSTTVPAPTDQSNIPTYTYVNTTEQQQPPSSNIIQTDDATSVSSVLPPNPPTVPLAAASPSPKERPRISTPDLIDGKTSRLVKELREIQDLRDLRGNNTASDGSYLMTPGEDNSAHLRRVSPLLNRLKDNAKTPVPDNCAYKSIIDTHKGKLLAPSHRQAVSGGPSTTSPTRQESPPRGGGGGLFSAMWAHRTNTSVDGGGGGVSGRGIYDAVDANQTYPSASTMSSRRAEKGSANVSPSRHQPHAVANYHPGHTSGDGSIGTPQRGATKGGTTTSTTSGDPSRLSRLINNLNRGVGS